MAEFFLVAGGGGSASTSGATINPVSSGATTISGTSAPNTAILIYKGANDTLLGRVVSDSSGNWSYTLASAAAVSDLYRAVANGAAFIVTSAVIGPTLNSLLVSSTSFFAGAAAGTAIGTISGQTAGSTITFTPNDGRVAVSSNGLVVGVTASSVGTIAGTLTETLAGAVNSPKTTSVNLSVGAALSISGSPGTASVGTPYTFSPSVSGGSGTKNFSLTGTLPAGLSFSSTTGAITGTPTSIGTTSGLVVTVSDVSGSAQISGLSIVVGAGPLSISGANSTANVGDTGSFTPTIAGGTAPYTVTATGLPPGRAIQTASTGLTTGSYTTAGSFNATYTVTDSVGATASFTRSVVVSTSATKYALHTDGQSLSTYFYTNGSAAKLATALTALIPSTDWTAEDGSTAGTSLLKANAGGTDQWRYDSDTGTFGVLFTKSRDLALQTYNTGRQPVIFYTGHSNDAGSLPFEPTNRYYNAMLAVAQEMRKSVPNAIYLLVPDTHRNGATNIDPGMQRLRDIQLQLCADYPAIFKAMPETYDGSLLSDGTHYDVPGSDLMVTRHARRIAKILGVNLPGNQLGPIITSAVLTGSTFVATIQHDGGTDFTPTSGLAGLRWFDGTSEISITGATRSSATQINGTLASTPTGAITAQKLYTAYGTISDVQTTYASGTLHDNAVEPLLLRHGTIVPTAGTGAVTLSTLTLSPTAAQTGSAYSGTISGKTSGSTVTATSSDGTALTVSGSTVSGTFSAAGTPTITLTETLAGATGSPKTSTATVTVSVPLTLSALTLAPTTATAGTAYSGTITGKTSGSTIAATSSDGTTLTISGTTVSGTFTAAGTPTVTLTETLAGATNTPRTSTQTVTVSAASSGATTFSDDFNTPATGTANMEDRTGWTKALGNTGAMTASGGKANIVAIPTVYVAPDIAAADHFASMALVADNSLQFPLLLKADTAGNGIGVRLYNGSVQVSSVAAGAASLLTGSVTGQPIASSGSPVTVRAWVIGTLLRVSVNGTTLSTTWTVPSGLVGNTRAGLYGRAAAVAAIVDSFACGTGP